MKTPSQFSHLTLADFQNAITPAYIKSLQVFYIALAAGVLVFFFVAIFFYVESADLRLGASEELLGMLTLVHVVYAAGAYAAATLVFRRTLSRSRAGTDGSASAESVLSAYRLASVIRLAIFEGVAFFGLVIIFIGAQTGILRMAPYYWINLFSTAILLGFVFVNFPNQERLEATCRNFVQEF